MADYQQNYFRTHDFHCTRQWHRCWNQRRHRCHRPCNDPSYPKRYARRFSTTSADHRGGQLRWTRLHSRRGVTIRMDLPPALKRERGRLASIAYTVNFAVITTSPQDLNWSGPKWYFKPGNLVEWEPSKHHGPLGLIQNRKTHRLSTPDKLLASKQTFS